MDNKLNFKSHIINICTVANQKLSAVCRILNHIGSDTSSFSDLVTLLNEQTIHQRCINFLMTEFFKYLNGLSPDLLNEVFRLKSNP